jgi:PmbA protein
LTPETLARFEETASRLVKMALQNGATDAECTIAEGEEFSVNVRMGEIETLTQSGSRGAGLRVLVGKHTGSAYTSDLSEDGLRFMVNSALELAKITTEDPFAGLPDEADFGRLSTDLQLYAESVDQLPPEEKITRAKQAEAAALAYDARVSNSDGSSFDTHRGGHAFANSRGFAGSYRTTSCSMSAVPVAKDGDSMERDYWMTAARSLHRLESPEKVGLLAAERTVRRLGARKVATQKVPVVFEPRTARSLLGHIFEAISGDSIYRHESYLEGKLGEKIATGRLTVVDDGTIPGLFGSSPFDDEGVPSRRTVVVENGVLKNYLLNTYTARKLGMKTTGNASRGLTGTASVGHNNFYIENGDTIPDEIIRKIKNGFYVTELMGDGVNVVTGDYSRGAAGIWIENGELTYPVHEVTIASTLQEMFNNIDTIGSDLEFRGSVAAPTLLIGEMTVSGQ